MMDDRQKQLVNAAVMLQDWCREHLRCGGCPFEADDELGGVCLLRDNIPGSWMLGRAIEKMEACEDEE